MTFVHGPDSPIQAEVQFWIHLPHLGLRLVKPSLEPGHWLWQSPFGFHDCMPIEDEIIETAALEERMVYLTDGDGPSKE